LTKFAEAGSIKVEELFGVHSFKTVHHLISTVTAQLKEEKDTINCIKASFPMGSMTGAPKIKAMELIEQYEKSKRGLFSGAVGYFSPENNFDFNVVIRSLLYNETQRYLSIQSGGAITIDSDPESEWEELNLKSQVLQSILNH
jgi:para-aminobenzoate synthetase component 1